MAEGRTFVCSSCAHDISAWDEGDPYYLDTSGEKHYAYHPSSERALCTGIDTPMLCRTCGTECANDSEAPITACPSCAAVTLVATWKLEGVQCPFCRKGTFHEDPNSHAIS